MPSFSGPSLLGGDTNGFVSLLHDALGKNAPALTAERLGKHNTADAVLPDLLDLGAVTPGEITAPQPGNALAADSCSRPTPAKKTGKQKDTGSAAETKRGERKSVVLALAGTVPNVVPAMENGPLLFEGQTKDQTASAIDAPAPAQNLTTRLFQPDSRTSAEYAAPGAGKPPPAWVKTSLEARGDLAFAVRISPQPATTPERNAPLQATQDSHGNQPPSPAAVPAGAKQPPAHDSQPVSIESAAAPVPSSGKPLPQDDRARGNRLSASSSTPETTTARMPAEPSADPDGLGVDSAPSKPRPAGVSGSLAGYSGPSPRNHNVVSAPSVPDSAASWKAGLSRRPFLPANRSAGEPVEPQQSSEMDVSRPGRDAAPPPTVATPKPEVGSSRAAAAEPSGLAPAPTNGESRASTPLVARPETRPPEDRNAPPQSDAPAPKQDSGQTNPDRKGGGPVPAKPEAKAPEHNGAPRGGLSESFRSVPGASEAASPAVRPSEPGTAKETSPAQAAPEIETKNVVAAQPARQISFQLGRSDTNNVNVLLTERAGKVQVAVRTPDHQLAKALQTDLGDLVGRLESHGFKAETWVPASGHRAAAAMADASNSANHREHGGAGGSSSGEQQQRREQNGSNARQRPRGLTAFQDTLSQQETGRESE
jgi:hypothetical protein